MDISQTSLAGKFFVLARLSMRGYIRSLILGSTKGADIPVSNPNTGQLFQVEVRTTKAGPFRSTIFGFNHQWMMDKKQESAKANNLVYCFVFLNRVDEMPRFFLVPSEVVAEYLTKEHAYWLAQPHKKKVKSTNIRAFRISLDATSHGLPAALYENKWELLDL